MKKEILALIAISIKKGIRYKRICALLKIDRRRVLRWRKREDSLRDNKPGVKQAPHALLKEEKDAILQFVLDKNYSDDAHRVLAAKGADLNLFYTSASSVYKVMRKSQGRYR